MTPTTLIAQQASDAIRPVLDRIVDRLHPEEIWLFGSRAEGRSRPDSDWDLLVVLPDDTDPALLDAVAAWQVLGGFDIPVDVIPCSRGVFEEEKLEFDTLPRAAWTRGTRLYVRTS